MRSIGVKLLADVSGYVSGLRTAQSSTRDFVGELDKAAKAGNLSAVADQAGRLGLIGAAAFGLIVKSAMDFDKQMSAVSAATHASQADMGRLRDAALAAGKGTQFSATQAAKGVEELAKAGVSTASILGGGLKGALDLAAAGSMDVGDAAEAAASAMTQFKLKGSDVPHVADLLAAGAGKAQGSVQQMSQALNQAGLVSAQMGNSVEDTVGTLTAFASAGLLGSDAGTSMRTMFLALANPTKKASDLMQELGINAYDTQGHFVGVTQLAGQLQSRLSGLTQEQRNAALATIFGADAIRAASILYQQGADGIQKWIDKANDQGYAAETARRKTDNLAGDIERLTGSLQTLAIESGSGANSGLRILVKGLDSLVTGFNGLPPAVGAGITVLTGVGAAALLLGSGWIKLRNSTSNMLDELRKTGPVGEGAASGLTSVTKWAGRAAVAFAALEVADTIIGKFQTDLNPQVSALAVGLERFSTSGQASGEMARLLGGDLGKLSDKFVFLADQSGASKTVNVLQSAFEAIIPGLDGTDGSLKNTTARVQAIDQALAQMVQGGQTQQASTAFRELSEKLVTGQVSMAEFKAQFPQYAAAVEVANEASRKASGSVDGVGAAATLSADKIKELNDAFNSLFGILMNADELAIKNKKSLAELSAELTHGARTLDINTVEGQKNASAVLDRIGLINKMRDSDIAQGASLVDANAKYVQNIDTLRASMRQAGFTQEAIDQLTSAYREVPGRVQTQVTAPGATTATGQADDFNFAVRNVPPSKTVPFYASTGEATAAVNALQAKINSLSGKSISVQGTVYWTSKGDMKVPGGTQLKNRWGGIYEHAAAGVLRDAHLAAATAPARYAYAEPATGGELFAPKYGNTAKTRREVGYAVENWWGGRVAWPGDRPRPQMAAPTTTVVTTYQVNVTASPLTSPAEVGRQVVEAVQQYERRSGKAWRS